jgi:Stress responsive A/B Barrel Domain
MITHAVLLQPKATTTNDEITTILNHVKELQQAIPGIISVQAGKNISDYNQGYTYGFIMQFIDIKYLKDYAPHPAHQIVSKELQRISEKIIDFDISN